MKLAFIFAMCILLSGCAMASMVNPQSMPHGNVNEKFDPAAAAYIFKPGRAKISGQVNLGGTVPGKFAIVRLVPVTAYSRGYLDFLFDGSKSYFVGKTIDNKDPRFDKTMRYARGDDVGNYVFHGVPPGEFYIYATVSDRPSGTFYAVMEHVTISSQKEMRIDLDGA